MTQAVESVSKVSAADMMRSTVASCKNYLQDSSESSGEENLTMIYGRHIEHEIIALQGSSG